MNNTFYTTIGKIFFAIAILGIGIVHFVYGHFPSGLLPVDPKTSGEKILAYIDGAALIIAALLIFSKKYEYAGACLAAITWLVLLIVLHLPKLIMTYNTPLEWTPTFEVAELLGGALVLMGLTGAAKNRSVFISIGSYVVGVAIFVFAVLHLIYLQFITTLIPAWIPGKLFWAYVVMIAFFAAAISLFTGIWLRLATTLLGLMFFIWFCILHIPLVIANYKVEPQWTSICVVLASSGVAFIIAGSTINKPKY